MPARLDNDQDYADIVSHRLYRDTGPDAVLHLYAVDFGLHLVHVLGLGNLHERHADADDSYVVSRKLHRRNTCSSVTVLHVGFNAYAGSGDHVMHTVPRSYREHNRAQVRRVLSQREKRFFLGVGDLRYVYTAIRNYCTGFCEFPGNASLTEFIGA